MRKISQNGLEALVVVVAVEVTVVMPVEVLVEIIVEACVVAPVDVSDVVTV